MMSDPALVVELRTGTRRELRRLILTGRVLVNCTSIVSGNVQQEMLPICMFLIANNLLMDGLSLSGYSSSLLSTLTVAAVLGLAWCVRNKLKHSRCTLKLPCLVISTHEDDSVGRETLRLEIMDELRAKEAQKASSV